jgi:hypothetical protein
MTSPGARIGIFGFISLTTLLLSARIGQAEYLYLSDDPLQVHGRLVRDLQERRVDTRNFSVLGKERLDRLLNDATRFSTLATAGPENQVCETLIVQFPKGQSLTFRTMHEKECFDWVITLSADPEEIEAVTFMGRPRVGNACGAPVILPPIDPRLPAAGQIIPPINDCVGSEPNRSSASAADIEKACSLWPKMCE